MEINNLTINDEVPDEVSGQPAEPTAATAAEPTAPEAKNPADEFAGIPAKFVKDGKVDVQALAKSYAELEKSFSSRGKKDDAAKDDGKTAGAGEPAVSEALDAAKADAEKTGFSFDTYEQEFSEKGELSPESYDKLKAAGFSRDTVERYIEGQKAVAERELNTVLETVGGRQAYIDMTTWARSNLSPANLDVFNKSVVASKESAVTAVKWLESQWKSANGSEPKLLRTSGASNSGSENFRSQAEIVKAVSDPRYKTDRAYRSDIEAKIIRSGIL